MKKEFVYKIIDSTLDLLRLNLFLTLYVNFRLLPISQAIKLPILCYGKIKAHSLRGQFVIDKPVHCGMIKIGYRWLDLWPVSYLPTQLCVRGTVKFSGKAIISGGVLISTTSKSSIISFGDSITIGGGCVIKSKTSISIGKRTRITGSCTVMDTNMHYIKNIATGKIRPNTGPIVIGEYCWINYGSVITKGAYIPSYSIVARNSFVGKNLKEEGENLFLAGAPAKIINKSVQRIFDYTREGEIRDFFILNPESEFYQDSIGVKDETKPFDINERHGNE